MAEFRTGTYPGYNKPDNGQHGTEIYFALIAEAEYADKLRWHKQAKKARDIVGR